MPDDDTPPSVADEKKLKPHERAEQTNIAFRKIVDREKSAEVAKTARLRAARLKRDAEESEGEN